MIHPSTELRFVSPEIGYGVFAKEFIPKGTIVYVKDSLEIEVTPKKYEKLDRYARGVVDKYSYRDERGYRIVSWDFAKYVNHSCNRNTISTGYGFEIALRDILPNEEVTDEYAIFNLEQNFECGCGSSNCRKHISPADFDVLFGKWDEEIKDALSVYHNSEQALEAYIDEALFEKLQHYLETGKNYKSVYSLRLKKHEGNGTLHKA